MSHVSPSAEEIRKETKVYVLVFVALMVLTVVTVAASYLDVSVGAAIALALAIAAIKGGLVAGFFMHLISERKLIYSVLALTVLFFLVLLFAPVWGQAESTGS